MSQTYIFVSPADRDLNYPAYTLPSNKSTFSDLQTMAWREKIIFGFAYNDPARMPDPCKRTFKETKTWYEDADEYWKGVPSNVNGMLGGLTFVHDPDVRDSLEFISALHTGSASGPGSRYACDCGAGIGRVTKHMLLSRFDKVDLVEQNKQFLDTAASQYLAPEIAAGRVGDLFAVGLQGFTPAAGRYDVIWCQWVLSHLTDNDLVAFLQRCASGLAPDGVVCVKENISSRGYIVDEEDSSVTRAASIYERLFKSAGMAVVHAQMQTGFQADMFAVKMWALRPAEQA